VCLGIGLIALSVTFWFDFKENRSIKDRFSMTNTASYLITTKEKKNMMESVLTEE